MNRKAPIAMIPLLDHKGNLSPERREEAMTLINCGFTAAELSIMFYDDDGKRKSCIVPNLVAEEIE